MVVLKVRTCEGVVFEVSEYLAVHMETLRVILDKLNTRGIVNLPRTPAPIFWKILEWCKYHKDPNDENQEECTRIGDHHLVYYSPWEQHFLDVKYRTLIMFMEACIDLGVSCLLRKIYARLNVRGRDNLPDHLKTYLDLRVFQ